MPETTTERKAIARQWETYKEFDPRRGLDELAIAARNFLPQAYDEEPEALPSNPLFQHMFAGLLMIADWFASSHENFPYGHAEIDRYRFARRQAKQMIEDLKLMHNAAANLNGKQLAPEAVLPKGWKPNAMQQAIANVPLPQGGGLLLLDSETASGKTEAAIIQWLRRYAIGLVSGLVFALPTRAAAIQMQNRITDTMERLFGDDAPPVVMGVPGYLRINHTDGIRLKNWQILWSDRDVGQEAWAAASSKRFLVAPVCVCTIDQCLMSVIRIEHAHLRAMALARQMLIVDEVHASDPYMHILCEKLIRRHVEMGGLAMIMSATLGAVARAGYFKEELPPLADAIKEPYPQISYAGEEGARIVLPVTPNRKDRKVVIERKPWIAEGDVEHLAKFALDHASRGARVLIIRNTVNQVTRTLAAIEALAEDTGKQHLLFTCKGVVAPHHSRFAAPDRVDLDNAVVDAFGKGCGQKPMILVATQTVEQSLDIDCDRLITDLCPMDVLLQRLGRLHRHDRPNRPRGYKTAKATVLVPERRNLAFLIEDPRWGFGNAYPDLRIIEATWREMEKHRIFVIPAMNRELVEMTTHPEALDVITNQLQSLWQAHGATRETEIYSMQQKARNALLDTSHGFGEIANIQGEIDINVRTRLGLDDSLAVFGNTFVSPFGNDVTELRIPGWMSTGGIEDPVVVDVVPGHAIHFTFGTRPKRKPTSKSKPAHLGYDRFGLNLA